jgi:hypothetical protein
MEQTAEMTNPHIAKMNEMRASMSDQERKEFNSALIAEARALLEKGDRMMEAEMDDVRQRLGIVPDVLSLSYIAEHYFGKSRTWLYQRINGNKVNGKPAYFTRSERKQLQEALQDIGKKLSAITLI